MSFTLVQIVIYLTMLGLYLGIKKEKLKIVTHHWGANWNKGFTTYSKIDELLDDKAWKEKIEFMYIGNLPRGLSFNNVNVVKPLSGKELSTNKRKPFIYNRIFI